MTLMRFTEQPTRKEELFEKYSQSMSRILMRVPEAESPSPLPCDLRPFDDFCFHGNRSILLWTWLRPSEAPNDAWEDLNTATKLLENQARAEHFEYHNMRIARACAIASSPPSDEALVYAYGALAATHAVIHQSSQSGEITEALEYLMDAAGTTKLIASGKEQARWHLDERRYRNEKQRSRIDRWMTAVFGFVGAAGLADLVIQPFLRAKYYDLAEWQIGLTAFALAAFGLCFLSISILIVNKMRRQNPV